MTAERSKRLFLIPIVFTTKCFKKPLLINFFLLNLIDHAVNLKRSERDPRKHCAIDHLSSHGYNFEGVFVFKGSLFLRGLRSVFDLFSRGLRLRLYLIIVCVIKRTALKAYNTITESP